MGIKRTILRMFRNVSKSAIELRKMGAIIGDNFHNFGTIDLNHCHLFKVGNNVTIASGAKIEFHDASTKFLLGYSRIGRIEIGNNVFIGANSIILPNVKIGDNVIVGAGSVVTRDIPNNSVAVGNPCRVIKTYEEFAEKSKIMFSTAVIYNNDASKMTLDEKIKQREELIDGGIYFDL